MVCHYYNITFDVSLNKCKNAILYFYRMKNFLLTLIFLSNIFQLQAEHIERTINWDPGKNIVSEPGIFSLPDFHGSFKTTNNSIPVYTENLKIGQSATSVQLANQKFTVIGNASTDILNSISENIELSYHSYYSGKDQYLQIELIPFIKKEGQILRLDSFDMELSEEKTVLKSAQTNTSWAQSSVLSSGKWVKIKTTGQGIYKISYTDLQSWGFTSPSTVNVYGNGGYMLPVMNNDFYYDDLQQNAVWHGKDVSNNDCLFFYSTGTVKWSYNSSSKMFAHKQNYFSDDSFYYLTDEGTTSLVQAESKPGTTPESQVNDYDALMVHENDETNVINSGTVWYGDRLLKGSNKTYTFNFTNRIETDSVKVFMKTIGRSSATNKLNVYENNSFIGAMSYASLSLDDVESVYGRFRSLRKDTVVAGTPVNIYTAYTASTDKSECWLDYIELNSRCKLQLSESQLLFRDIRNVKSGSVTQYTISNAAQGTQIWDISDFIHPVSIPTEQSGNDLKIVVSTDRLREFVAFNPAGTIPVPEKVGELSNQNLHGATVPELLIVTHPGFISQANEIASFHRENDQMTVAVYSTEQIYNEFSSGLPDAAGIRNFIRMCYEKSSAENQIKYVLLIGDGSFDNKDIRGKGYNLIPTYQSDESLLPTGSFVSDDFFVLLDSNEGGYIGLVDLGIGRIPARTSIEASAVVEKIKNYTNSDALGKWRNTVCFIADDGNTADKYTNQHANQSESIADLINLNYPEFYTDKIYFDAYRRELTSGNASYPDVNDAINERVEEGVLIMNYIGHANNEFLADERVLDISTIDAWSNYKNLPIFVTATCEFSRFDDDDLSAGEHILFNANGGGIGLFSTTRLVYSGANFNLTKSFYNHVFEKDTNGENLRMGDIMRLAKIGSDTGTNKRNFTLLADPALQLAYPQLKVKTETINGMASENFTETVSALEKITITGSITDYFGNIETDFNGTVIPIVYDKAIELETLGNAGQTTMTFTMQDNIIYKGNVSVINGAFSFSFVVPKDISYSIDNGKIIYYADNGEIDANGAFDNFLIGGSSTTTIIDNEGPDIKMYMNNTDFKNGDKVGAAPLLIAEISDENGINTVGTGIGHDITAIIDGDNSTIYVLNDYYESDIDSYTSGKIVYPLNDLEPGKHSLTLKVWDVVNNSSEATIEFVITSDFQIEELICYPNPVSDYAYFSFTHNLPDELFSATFEVFDRSGSRIDYIEKQIPSEGTESVPLKWQPSSRSIVLKDGLYLFRFTLISTEGYISAKTGKFIFIKK